MWRVYKHTGKEKDYEVYKEALNAATNELRESKRNFGYKLANNIKPESKSLNASQSSLPFSKHRSCALLCAGFSRTLHRVSYFVYF